jgi:hypothetical protein
MSIEQCVVILFFLSIGYRFWIFFIADKFFRGLFVGNIAFFVQFCNSATVLLVPSLLAHCLMQVYAEYQFIRSNLTDPRFQLTDSLADADILWLASHFKDYREFRCTSFQSCVL